jgi:5-methylthioadenosine/S-adenosylhomocysteine deaminase
VETGMELRPRLPLAGRRAPTGPSLALRAADPLSTILQPLTLDPLTVADDSAFLDRIEAQTVLPAFVRENLRALY